MPAIRTMIDGVSLARVSTDGYNLLSVRINGTRVSEELATVEVTGGIYPEGKESTYLIWAADIVLQHNQRVVVQFLQHGETSHQGKTIDEQYPDEVEFDEEDFTLTADLLVKLKAMQKLRDGFVLALYSSSGTEIRVDTKPADHGFAFSIDWDSSRLENARMSLHTYTLEGVEAKTDGEYHAREKLNYGDEVSFELLP